LSAPGRCRHTDAAAAGAVDDAAMNTRIAVAAKIRPGKRAKLEQMLSEGPPFDLADAGFDHHQVFLGDEDIFFLFEGGSPVSAVKRLAAERTLMGHVLRMAGVLSSPHLLAEEYSWDRPVAAPAG
jgi:hypothetical protein